ncbi:MAG: SRPBCC domain-containing protein [Terracidiphilus sp.]
MDIFASVQLEAEMERVLHALAVPEYMEAWMQPPDAERIECHSDPRSFDRFRIDLLSERGRQRSICGSCFLTKPNRITYIWETGPIAEARSLVEIRLWRYLTKCTIKLKHSGLRTWADRDWHAKMWDASLNKLRVLMQGTRAGPLGLAHRWV